MEAHHTHTVTPVLERVCSHGTSHVAVSRTSKCTLTTDVAVPLPGTGPTREPVPALLSPLFCSAFDTSVSGCLTPLPWAWGRLQAWFGSLCRVFSRPSVCHLGAGWPSALPGRDPFGLCVLWLPPFGSSKNCSPFSSLQGRCWCPGHLRLGSRPLSRFTPAPWLHGSARGSCPVKAQSPLSHKHREHLLPRTGLCTKLLLAAGNARARQGSRALVPNHSCSVRSGLSGGAGRAPAQLCEPSRPHHLPSSCCKGPSAHPALPPLLLRGWEVA